MSILYPFVIPINRGSDWEAVVTLKHNGSAIDLTNWTVSKYNVTAAIDDFLVVEKISDELGTIRVRVEWDETLQTGVTYSFQVRLFDDPEDATTQPIGVAYE